MCNAWNHPPGCNCGWGGEGHLGGGGGHHVSTPTRSSAPKVITRKKGFFKNFYSTYETFVTPNATCPVCGEQVFYYQSPYGGKVYFDSLGPPWPKHPCTDNYSASTTTSIERKTSQNWSNEGWEPFFIEKIKNIDTNTVLLFGYTIRDSKKAALFSKKTEYCHADAKLNLCQIKNNNSGTYLFSTFILNSKTNNVEEHVFICAKIS